MLYPLESRFPPWDASKGAPDGIVVLGGSIGTELSAAHDVPVFKAAADRLIHLGHAEAEVGGMTGDLIVEILRPVRTAA